MRRILHILSFPFVLCFAYGQICAQESIDLITGIEYFINVDPGFGNATALEVSEETSFETIFNAVIEGLEPNKMHTIGIRAKNGESGWGHTAIHRFFVNQLLDEESTPTLTTVEYFIDEDVGYNAGNEISFEGETEVQLSPLINLTELSEGSHVIGVRVKDENTWGHTYFMRFYIDNSPIDPDFMNVTQIEYFFDSDAGFEESLSIDISPVEQLTISPILDISSLQEGYRCIGIRAKSLRAWGSTQILRFLVDDSNTNTDLEDVTTLEFFVDTDSGYGNSNTIEVSSSSEIQIMPLLQIPEINSGSHIVGIRAMNSNTWGQTHIHRFFAEEDFPNGQPVNLSFIEYYLNNDPEFENGIRISLEPCIELDTTINPILDGLDYGVNMLGIRACDERGNFSQTYIHGFNFVPYYTITASNSEHGAIIPVGEILVDEGNNQLFDLQPDIGYHIHSLLVDGEDVGSVTTYEFANVTANHTIHVEFVIDTLIISATVGENGTISPEGDVEVTYGSGQLFTISPNIGYHALDVLVDGESVGVVESYEFVDVTQNHTIHAEFEIDTLIIVATAGENGTISPMGNVEVTYGSNQQFTFTPNNGYHIQDVVVDGESVGAVEAYEFVNVTENHTIHVEFEIDIVENAQIISLQSGWNIFSTYIIPENADMLNILEPLIATNRLIKVQDQWGNALEYINNEWVNMIGNVNPAQGYLIKVTNLSIFTITGELLAGNIEIPLIEGWNIMGYPYINQQNVVQYLDPLIENEVLQKVQSQTGAAMEYLPNFGWINSIGDLFSGQGYRIRLSDDAVLNEGGTRFEPQKTTDYSGLFFNPSWKGMGINHMNLYVHSATLDGEALPAGTQIGVFDGDDCVGLHVVSENNGQTFTITATHDDPYTTEKDGFTQGNRIKIKIRNSQLNNQEYVVNLVSIDGNPIIFEPNGSLLFTLQAVTDVNHDKILFAKSQFINISPNPFSGCVTISFHNSSSNRVKLEAIDLFGKIVEVLIDREVDVGLHTIEWNAKAKYLPSGVYIIRMTTGELIESKRVVYIK